MALQSVTHSRKVLKSDALKQFLREAGREWPVDRLTDTVIAERMVAAALYNYHRCVTKHMDSHDFKTWPDLTDEQQAFLIDFLIDFAIPQAMSAIWKGGL